MSALEYGMVADGVVIGLEFFRLNREQKHKAGKKKLTQAKNLLIHGVTLCDLLSAKMYPSDLINMLHLESFRALQYLNVHSDNLVRIIDNVKEAKPYLEDIINENIIPSDDKIVQLQQFFSELSAIYFRSHTAAADYLP